MTVYYVPALIYLLLTIAVIGAVLSVSALLGKRRITPEKMMPYECGVDPIGSLDVHFPIRFYIVAMLFIIFDIETVFLYPWAVVFGRLGWLGLVEMFIFTAVLLIGLVYLYRKGALEWE
jgi:NADH-quinone oxidoreductase subunit A